MFYYQGIPSTGVDSVVARAGVAKMSLYRHFGSKDQLVVECLELLDRRYHEWFVRQVEDTGGEPADKLLAIFDVLDGWFHSSSFRGCAFMNATVQLADPTHPAHAPIIAHKRRDRDYIQTLAVAAGVADPAALSRQIMLLAEGSIITALVQEDLAAATDAKEAARVLVRAAIG